MLARKRFEIETVDLLRGMADCCRPIDRATVLEDLEREWLATAPEAPAAAESCPPEAYVALSVRSTLDLYLTASAFAPGDEIVMSGANIPDMARVIEAHGLKVVTVDFDLGQLGPSAPQIEAALTERTRAVLFAQLFGGIVPLDSIAELCRDRGIDLLEDCAQAFLGPEYRGHPGATLALFSFGPIKSATALAGAITTVRHASLRQKMLAVESTWPVAENAAFFQRLIKYLGLATLTRELPYGLLGAVARSTGRDLDRLVGTAARSFPADRLFEQLRRQPCDALLSLLRRRQRDATTEFYRDRETLGRQLAVEIERATGGAVHAPGLDRDRHSFWVYPVLVDGDPDALVARCRAAQLDATRLATLAPLAEADALPELHAAFERLVYLPFDASLNARWQTRLVEAVAARPHSHETSAPGSVHNGIKTGVPANR